MTKLTVAALQLAFTDDREANIRAVGDLVREAAAKGARGRPSAGVVRRPLFLPGRGREPVRDRAADRRTSLRCWRCRSSPSELEIWIPTSFFEAEGPHHYNSLAMIGPDGKVAGVYRKSHIPDGPGYEEKFYFRPGNTGFKVWSGPHKATLGVGVCWDQWYPETARAMMLMGADILFYPTAIGTEPHDPDLDTQPAVAAGDDRPCGLERRAGGCRQPHRHGRQASASTATASSATSAATCLPSSGRRRPGSWSRRSTSPPRRNTAPRLASSATGGRSFTGG